MFIPLVPARSRVANVVPLGLNATSSAPPKMATVSLRVATSHTKVPALLAVMPSALSSGLKASDETKSRLSGTVSVATRWRVARFHREVLPSAALTASVLASWLKARALACAAGSGNVAMLRPVAVSQTPMGP